jgi:uncharacterized protein YjiK
MRSAGAGLSASRKKSGLKPALLVAVLAFTGCATRGPLHVYSLTESGERPVLDTSEAAPAEVPSFVEANERVSGFAYDPFTDHFFLRLDPGNRIRVVDRPARKIKRELTIAGAPENSRGDLAARPRDGHLFLLLSEGASVLEATRFGKIVRTFALDGVAGVPSGIAFDMIHDRLLVLAADGRRVTVHDLDGKRRAETTLDHVAGGSLAFDAERRELYAPLRDRAGEIGVFDEHGKLVRTLRAPGRFVDVGPRSFVRVF